MDDSLNTDNNAGPTKKVIKMSKSTVDYYHKRRKVLLTKILERNLPIQLKKDEQLFCQLCKSKEDEVKELHIEHPNGDGEQDDGGGWQRLYKHENHFENRKDLYVVCEECHYLLHKRRGDGHAETVKMKHDHLDILDENIEADGVETIIRNRFDC